MKKKAVFITDMEGLLISDRNPVFDGRNYMVAAKTVSGKKYITKENVEKLKILNLYADIVPMTKLAARQSNTVSLCVPTPISLVEGGSILLRWTKPDMEWRSRTAEIILPDYDLLHEGKTFLSKKGYISNGSNEFTLDYIGTSSVSDDIEELRKLIGHRFKVIQVGENRIYVYHLMLSRREMVKRFISRHEYDTVITASAPFTGWMPENGNTISTADLQAKYEYNGNYDKDPHKFASFAIDQAIKIIKEKTY